MSEWFHAKNGQQSGPVTEEAIRRLVGSGALGPDDLVWRDGMPDWVPVKTLPQLAPLGAATIPPPPAASNPYRAPASPMMAASSFGTRGGGDIDLGEAISLGWQGFVQNAVLGSVGALVYLVIALVLGFIPLVSIVSPILIGYPLLAGVFYMGVVAVDNARGNPREVVMDDLFVAFRENYGQTVLYSLLLTVGFVAFALVVGLSLALLIPQAEEQAGLIVLIVLVLMIPIMYVALRLWFGYQYLADKRLSAIESFSATWRATQGQLLSLLALGLLAGVIYVIGMLLLMVGIFPAMFLIACISGAAFRQIAGD